MPRWTAAVPLLLLLLAPGAARAHCDSLDGPVIRSARQALDSGKVTPVLAWIRPQDEGEIRAAFDRTLLVRKGGAEARALADTWFFETLVRGHRAGEGAPYTGLRPAGGDPGPAVRSADAAVDKGSPAATEKLLVDAVKKGLHQRFARLEGRKSPPADVAAGRAWVAAYVPYVHWVEGVYEKAAGGGEVHGHGGPEEAVHGHGGADAGPARTPPAHLHADSHP